MSYMCCSPVDQASLRVVSTADISDVMEGTKPRELKDEMIGNIS